MECMPCAQALEPLLPKTTGHVNCRRLCYKHLKTIRGQAGKQQMRLTLLQAPENHYMFAMPAMNFAVKSESEKSSTEIGKDACIWTTIPYSKCSVPSLFNGTW